MSSSEVSVNEAMTYWETDESQLINVALGEFLTRHKITKVVYRQKKLSQDEYAIEVLPRGECELNDKELDLLSSYCRKFANNSFFDIYEAVEGVIYYEDSEVKFCGRQLEWVPCT